MVLPWRSPGPPLLDEIVVIKAEEVNAWLEALPFEGLLDLDKNLRRELRAPRAPMAHVRGSAGQSPSRCRSAAEDFNRAIEGTNRTQVLLGHRRHPNWKQHTQAGL